MQMASIDSFGVQIEHKRNRKNAKNAKDAKDAKDAINNIAA
jgi:hypothetical protein